MHILVGTALAKELELTISDSIDLALKSNLDIQLQKSTLDKLRWDNSWKWSSILPKVVASAGLSRSNVEPSQWRLSRSISISTPIGPLLIQKILETVSTNFTFDKGELTYENAIKKILVTVQKAYYDILIAQKELSVLERQLQVNIEQNKNLQTAYESGLVEEYNYLQSQIQRLQIEQQVNTKQNSIITLSNNFALLIGEKEGTQFVFIDDVPAISQEQVASILSKKDLDNNTNTSQRTSKSLFNRQKRRR